MISTDQYVPINGKIVKRNGLFDLGTDSEPDIFKINILGETLNCMFDRNNSQFQLIVLNKKGYQVEYTNTDKSWKVTDPNGTKFIFKTNSEVIGYLSKMISKVWFINEIITVEGKSIKFNYSDAGKFEICSYSECHYVKMAETGFIVGSSISCDFIGYFGGTDPYFTPPNQINIRESQLYLNSIESSKKKVYFTTSGRTDIPGKRKLDSLVIKNMNNETVGKSVFSYTYFQGSEDVPSAKRLKLLSVKINNDNPYHFEYNNEPLPSVYSFATDFWGFYNGNFDNKSLSPNPVRFKKQNTDFSVLNENSYSSVTKDNHSARLQYTKAGTLEQIKYPTGGCTSFEYSLNQFSNYWVPDYNSTDNTISTGNGLRVDRILVCVRK
jgi:hypothetical protein